MTSPSATSMAGGQRPRPRPKSGRPEGKTVGRHELARHARFAELSPEVGVLDEQALNQALAEDPAVFELLAAMTNATDERLRAAAIRLSSSIVLERARAGRTSFRGTKAIRASPVVANRRAWRTARGWPRPRRLPPLAAFGVRENTPAFP